MGIEFTKEQFGALLKVVYLGNWLANAIHDGSKDDPMDGKLDAVEDYVFSFAKEFDFDDYIEYDEESKRYFPTNKFDELVQKYIDGYDENCFWEELFYRMYDRDFTRVYSSSEILGMEMKERFGKEEPFREKWDKEINDHGIDRLEIDSNNQAGSS